MIYMDLDRARDTIVDFIRTKTEEAGVNGVVVGLSGGIDSALTAYLAVEALGKENVLGVHLPETGFTPAEDVLDATEVANRLGIEFNTIDITGILGSFLESIPEGAQATPLSKGNLKARIRMSILYYYSNLTGRMVIGTGNKTEILIGYYTKYGDGGVDIEPIGDLYKTEVWELAGMMDVPEDIINKAPSAGLWAGQTDEEELGISYKLVDRALEMLLDGEDEVYITDVLGLKKEQMDSVVHRIVSNAHKREVPPLPSLEQLRI